MMIRRGHSPFFLVILAFGLAGAGTVSAAWAANSRAPRVEKVDPPNWWVGHTLNPVRLLVRGANLHQARVTATTAGVTTQAVVINPAGTYVFVSVVIDAHAAPGEHPLRLETPAGEARIPFRLEAPLDPADGLRGLTNDDVIYLIMPDRFANGDPSNDIPPGAPPSATDRENPRAYHGGDLRGITNRLPYFKDLGVTALWLNPWHDNANGLQPGPAPKGTARPDVTTYHGYHAIDQYSVEDRFGDISTLKELVAKAHAMGLKVIQDQVANHVGSGHPWVADPPLDNWFNPRQVIRRPFRTDVLMSPHASAPSVRAIVDGWFTDRLADMNQREPEVARYLIQNSLWWLGTTGIDGIRQDTLQYMPRPFIRELCLAIHRQYPRLRMVGEVWDADPAYPAFFMGGRPGWDGIDTDLDAVFDFPLWQTSRDVFTHKKPVSALRNTLKLDGLYPDASRLVTMVGNHDVARFLSLEGGTLTGAMLHTAFTLATRGTPQLYYGDEILMTGATHDSNRGDFPGGFPGDAQNAFEAAGRPGDAGRMYQWTRDWLALRREHAAMRRGVLIDLAWDDESYLFARQDADDVVLIAINRSAAAREISAPADGIRMPAKADLRPLLGGAGTGRVTGGTITVTVPPETVVPFGIVGKEPR
jgi:glycosidase